MTSTTEQPRPAAPEQRVARLGGLDIAYDERILQPRAWTAAQSAWAAELLAVAAPGPVLELCTGAGHIGLLAILGNDRRLVAVDADRVACGFARANAADAGLGDRVEVRNATLGEALAPDELFPVIIADPPWVPSARTGEHPDDPLPAIDGGQDGLEIARLCLEVARAHLTADGTMLLQLGTTAQATALQAVLDAEDAPLTIADVRQPSPTGIVALVRRRITRS
ncbi:MAG TPA: class I SAM-dependent methyltransferase [Marmoricola sp.]|nr:class I SAM-dependent methyltransferase [Marmoricola sp.]